MLNKIADNSIVVVPYKGSGGSLLDLVAGRVQAYSGATGTMVSNVKAGQIRPLATFESERVNVFSDVPTIGEAGFPDLTMNAWYGLFAPAGTPRNIIEDVNKQLAKSLTTKEVQDTLAVLGNSPISGIGPDQFSVYLKSDIERWRKAVEIAGKS
jgi:tripartite-type tricarboxylate transporter receptor subunit TctC